MRKLLLIYHAFNARAVTVKRAVGDYSLPVSRSPRGARISTALQPIKIRHKFMDEDQCADHDAATVANSHENGLVVGNEGPSDREPCVGMEFDSEEAAKVFYDAYATNMGFIMRVDAFRRSMRDGSVVWRRLVCNKEGFRKCRPKRSETRKPRAITREGCKAMIVVKKEKTGKWIVTKFFKEHNHPLVVEPGNVRRSVQLSQTPDEKDMKIRQLTTELQRERKRSAALQEQLNSILKDMEEHSKHLSRNITNIIQSVNEIESRRIEFPRT